MSIEISHGHISKNRRIAENFYEEKLDINPHMAKYNQSLAAIKLAHNQPLVAHQYYKAAHESDPQNVMIRNDYALNMARQGNLELSRDNFKRALHINDSQPTLHKNLSSVYARDGHYKEAHEHARRSVQLNGLDPMALRNLAKLKDTIGDSRSALPYYLKAIDVETMQNPDKINTAAYRQAAVLTIAQGGSHQDALSLMHAARKHAGLQYKSPTTEKTNEIIASIKARKGDILEKLEHETKRRQDALKLKAKILDDGLKKYLPNIES
eukprot:gene10852-22653_t